MDLYDWQEEDVKWLQTKSGAIVAHSMGLGKTIITLKLIERLGCDALIITPKSMIGQWLTQATLWVPGLDARVHDSDGTICITNYERVRARFDDFDKRWDMIVLDEAQRIKNWDTQTARMCKSLKADRKFALTGTPVENSINDLYSICDFIGLDVVHNICGFEARHFFEPRTIIAKQIARSLKRKKYGPKFKGRISDCVGEIMIRRRLDDVLEMPPVVVKRVEVDLDPEERRVYNEILLNLRTYIDGREFNVVNALSQLTYLREVCNGVPTLLDSVGTSSKMDEVIACAHDIAMSGHKSIIFSDFLRMASRLVDRLKGMGYLVGELSGRVKDYDEEKARDWDIMVCTKAGENGHDLQRASYVLNVDLPYNPARVLQRVGRARRVGQDRGVVLINFICPGTVEERILDILYEKRKVFYDVIDNNISMDRDLIKRIVEGPL